MEVSGYLHAFGRFVLSKDLVVFIGWEVGGLLIWSGHDGRGKNVLPSYWCAEIRMSVLLLYWSRPHEILSSRCRSDVYLHDVYKQVLCCSILIVEVNVQLLISYKYHIIPAVGRS